MNSLLVNLPNTNARWERYREQLAFEYLDNDGAGTESCTLVAIKIGKLLIADGLSPHILTVRTDDTLLDSHEPLVPKPYKGRYEWGAHHVAMADDHVFDPILEAPEPLITYPLIAFGVLTLKIETNDWMLNHQGADQNTHTR